MNLKNIYYVTFFQMESKKFQPVKSTLKDLKDLKDLKENRICNAILKLKYAIGLIKSGPESCEIKSGAVKLLRSKIRVLEESLIPC